MNIYISLLPVDGNATGPLLTNRIVVYNNNALVVRSEVTTQVLPDDTAPQMQAKCKADIDAFVAVVTGSAPPANTKYVVFGGRSN